MTMFIEFIFFQVSLVVLVYFFPSMDGVIYETANTVFNSRPIRCLVIVFIRLSATLLAVSPGFRIS